jgi:hypothetical protein
MTPERWRQVKEICGAVLDHPPEQRDAVLAHICANDNELKREVEAMLDQATSGGSILSRPIWEELKVAFSLIGQQLSQYKITEKIGSGGMGEVYRARDTKLKRDVAIKVLPDEFSRDADRVSRFQREAQVLASLNHPNIAAIYDLQEANHVRSWCSNWWRGRRWRIASREVPSQWEKLSKLPDTFVKALKQLTKRESFTAT